MQLTRACLKYQDIKSDVKIKEQEYKRFINLIYGLKDAKEFGFEWDSVPLDPLVVEIEEMEDQSNLANDESFTINTYEISTFTTLFFVMITVFFGFIM